MIIDNYILVCNYSEFKPFTRIKLKIVLCKKIEKKHKKSRALHGFFVVEPLVVGITCRFASLKAQQLAERNKSESRRRQRA